VGIEDITVVCIEIDTYVLKMMVLEEGARRGDWERGRRGLRCGGYRVIRPKCV
jgi:hypothetical protein